MNSNALFKDKKPFQQSRKRIAFENAPSLLIIDDDIDASLPIQTFLSAMNVNCRIVSDPRDAKKLLCSGNWDLVILDWMLNEHLTGAQVLGQSEKMFSRIDELHLARTDNPLPIITYSVLPRDLIDIPESDHFYHMAHWRKPVDFRNLRKHLLAILQVLSVPRKGGS
ncbi:MAG: hypothetical protein NDI61_08025 [Bdellovibrionaceae bacterium]|nr:hypothetical protein [Pseudobdellovibrionaceae bacterium]